MARTTKPIRVKEHQLDILSSYKKSQEPWSVAIESLLEEASGTSVWVLPSEIYKTKKEATRVAMERGALANLTYEDIELPIKVKRLN